MERRVSKAHSPPELDIPPMPAAKTKKAPGKHVRKMRKPPIRSPVPSKTGKTHKDGKMPAGKPGPGAPPKKDVERRMVAVHRANERLKAKSERLGAELASLREEENAIEQERDRLQQLWMISRCETEEERETRHSLEKSMHRMRSVHQQSITVLQQKMRSLLLASKTTRVVATQTEFVYVGGPFEDRQVQTVEELTREKAAVHLREKLNAQSDLKYAIVQLEQRMKEERESELRRLREEKVRQLEEIAAIHGEELRRVEDETEEEAERARDDIARLQAALADAEEARDQLRIDLQMKRGVAERAEDEAARSRRDRDRIAHEHGKLLARSEAVKRDAAQMERMRREVAKYKEINEILLGEYAKLEEDREDLMGALERGVSHLEIVNRRRTSKIRQKIGSIQDTLNI